MTDADTTLAAARRALDAGRPDQARADLKTLLAARPDWAEARFHLARAQAALGEPDAAQAGFDAALAAAPKEPAIWMEMALFAHGVGMARDAVKRARRADLPPALVTMIAAAATGQGARALGTGAAKQRDLAALSARLKSGDARGLEAMAAPLLRQRPGALVLAMLGQGRLRSGQLAQAAEAFRNGLRLEPYAVDLRLGLTQALARAGQGTAALSEARRTAIQAPAWAEAQLMFARLALSQGVTDPGARAAEAALALAPRSDAALTLAAEAALAQGRAEHALDLAARRKPDARGRYLLLARAAAAARLTDESLRAYKDGLARAPNDADLRVARAQFLQSLGQAEAAEADLMTTLAERPGHGTAARALAYGQRLDPAAPVVAGMAAALEAAETTAADKRLLHYALARTLEKSDPRAAFDHLRQANDATAAAFPFDPEADRRDLARIIGPDWAALCAGQTPSTCQAAPIFVTGLPRSGTTLVETILAAHSGVRAGGELAVLNPVLTALATQLRGGGTPDSGALTDAGAAYAAAADRAGGGADPRRLTDKSIHTFTQIGAVQRILPRARIVVVHRDPRDTGLSIWRNHFPDGTHRYAASQQGIADHIALFHEAVAFWRAELPGAFHEIHYEALLDDPEGEARKLLQACDLEWEEEVLTFHERAERVDTLSFAQVRQPLYRSSHGAWRAHAADIAPLIGALEGYGLLPKDVE